MHCPFLSSRIFLQPFYHHQHLGSFLAYKEAAAAETVTEFSISNVPEAIFLVSTEKKKKKKKSETI